MAYCKSCGAYIPDGQSACLACGYDENAKQSSGGQAAAAAAEWVSAGSWASRTLASWRRPGRLCSV